MDKCISPLVNAECPHRIDVDRSSFFHCTKRGLSR
jgi:hypothetical protein